MKAIHSTWNPAYLNKKILKLLKILTKFQKFTWKTFAFKIPKSYSILIKVFQYKKKVQIKVITYSQS